MPVARCPRCESPVTIDDADLGHDVECPTCRAVFSTDDVLGPPAARRSTRARPDDEFEEDDDYEPRPRRRRRDEPEDVIADARRDVFIPGVLLVAVSVVGIGLEGMALLMIALMGPQQMQQQMANMPFMNAGPPPPPEVLVGARFVAIAWESVILAGVFCMMRGRAYGFARVAMVMRLIPCAGMCCLAGLPFGIWALAVLNRPRVRKGFELAATDPRGRSPDRE